MQLSLMMVGALLAQSPAAQNESSELDRIRRNAVLYYNSIKTIELEYSQVTTESADPLSQEYRKRVYSQRRKTFEENHPNKLTKPKPERLEREAIPQLSTLIDSYPSFLYKNKLKVSESNKLEDEMIKAFHNNKYYEAKIDHRYVYEGSGIDVNKIPNRTPIQAIGKRIPSSLNLSLADMLSSKQVTITKPGNLGKSIVVTIGPNIEDKIRPKSFGHDAIVRITLENSNEWKVLSVDYVIHSSETKDVLQFWNKHIELDYNKKYIDINNNNNLDLWIPTKILFRDGMSDCKMDIQAVRLNRPLTDSDLVPKIPDGFTHSIDGAVPKVFFKGGGSEQSKALERIRLRTETLLNSDHRKTAPDSNVRFYAVTLAVVVIAFFTALYSIRRLRRA